MRHPSGRTPPPNATSGWHFAWPVLLIGYPLDGASWEKQERVLLGAIPPYLLKTDANPEGVDPSVFDRLGEASVADRPAQHRLDARGRGQRRAARLLAK